MKENSTTLSTKELWAALFQAPGINYLINEYEKEYELPEFSDYITELCRVRGLKHETIIKRSNLGTSFGHRLFSGKRNPSRDTVIMLAFGFGMNVDETQQLLKVAQAALLHPKVKRDAVIAFCLYHNMSLIETQIALEDNGMPLIGGGNREKE